MAATPPPQGQQGPSYGRGMNVGAMMPMPANAELILYVIAVIIVAIITLASDSVNADGFVTAFTVLTLAYLVSRGIAKAGKVLER